MKFLAWIFWFKSKQTPSVWPQPGHHLSVFQCNWSKSCLAPKKSPLPQIMNMPVKVQTNSGAQLDLCLELQCNWPKFCFAKIFHNCLIHKTGEFWANCKQVWQVKCFTRRIFFVIVFVYLCKQAWLASVSWAFPPSLSGNRTPNRCSMCLLTHIAPIWMYSVVLCTRGGALQELDLSSQWRSNRIQGWPRMGHFCSKSQKKLLGSVNLSNRTLADADLRKF